MCNVHLCGLARVCAVYLDGVTNRRRVGVGLGRVTGMRLTGVGIGRVTGMRLTSVGLGSMRLIGVGLGRVTGMRFTGVGFGRPTGMRFTGVGLGRIAGARVTGSDCIPSVRGGCRCVRLRGANTRHSVAARPSVVRRSKVAMRRPLGSTRDMRRGQRCAGSACLCRSRSLHRLICRRTLLRMIGLRGR